MRIFLAILIVSCCVLRADEKPVWSDKMKQLAATIDDILPQIASKKTDSKRYLKDAEQLTKLVHGINQKSSKAAIPPDADPTIPLVADLFEQETKRAYQAAKEGQFDYSKNILRTVTGYCIACHSRHDKGPEFKTFGLKANLTALPPFERASLLAATRQFDRALSEYDKLLPDGKFRKAHVIDWERSLREAMAIAVRVKKDPELALKMVNDALAQDSIPDYVRVYLNKWKDTIERWKAEPTKTANTEEGELSEATRLLQEARQIQTYPADHSADILYLRASQVAHEYLGKVKGEDAAKGLLLEGLAYEVLNNQTLSPLHELYFQACVRKAPHTSTAEQCFQHYEQSIFFGYSGSGGTSIPPELEKDLKDLKEMAKPKA